MRHCAPSRNVRRRRRFSLIEQRGRCGVSPQKGVRRRPWRRSGGRPSPSDRAIAPSRLQSRVRQSILCRSIAPRSGNISRQWKAGQDDCRTEKRTSPGKSQWSRSVMHEFRRSNRRWRSNSTPCAPPDVIGSSRIVHRARRQTARVGASHRLCAGRRCSRHLETRSSRALAPAFNRDRNPVGKKRRRPAIPDQGDRHHDAGGRLLLHVFAALAQFERDLIRERIRAGLTAAAARGRRGEKTRRNRARQWPHPRQQGDKKSPRIASALAHRRVAAEVCAGTRERLSRFRGRRDTSHSTMFD